MDAIFNNLPIIKVFKGLRRGDTVYSKQYGIGKIESLYKEDEIIVQFSSLRKRLSVHDNISKIPVKYLQKPKYGKVEVIWDGKNISFAELKRRNQAERDRIKLEEEILKEKQKMTKLVPKVE